MSSHDGEEPKLAGLGVEAYATRYGQTPLDLDAFEFLTARYQGIRTLAQLNEAEAQNIEKAMGWLERQSINTPELLHQSMFRLLHGRMYGDVWTWAGTYRARETNIGIEPSTISHQLEIVLGNTLWQVENPDAAKNTDTHLTELGVRLHRSLTAIHPFPNGNGRHARLFTEQFADIVGLPAETFTWGFRTYSDPELARNDYLDALRHADMTDDHGPLIQIATS